MAPGPGDRSVFAEEWVLMSENWRYLSYDFRLGFNNWGRRFSMKNWVAKFWPKASKDHRVIWISSTLWFIDLNIDKIFNLPPVQNYFTLKCEQWLWFKSFRNIRSQVRIPPLDIRQSRDLSILQMFSSHPSVIVNTPLTLVCYYFSVLFPSSC